MSHAESEAGSAEKCVSWLWAGLRPFEHRVPLCVQYLEIVQAEDEAAAAEQLKMQQAQAADRAQNGSSSRQQGSPPKQKPRKALRMGFRFAVLHFTLCTRLNSIEPWISWQICLLRA